MRSRGGSDDDPARRLQVGYMKLYDPAVRHARAVAADRGFGPPRAIEVTVLHPTSEAQLAHARLLPQPTDVEEGIRASLGAASDALRRDALGDAAATRLRAALHRHPARQRRPRALPRPRVRRRSDRRRRPDDVAGRGVATLARADRQAAGRRARLDPLAFPARLSGVPRSGPDRLCGRHRRARVPVALSPPPADPAAHHVDRGGWSPGRGVDLGRGGVRGRAARVP